MNLKQRAGSHAARRPQRAGFSMIEVMVAAVILAIAVSSISGSIISSLALNRVNRDTALAQTAARRMLESLSGQEFDTLFLRFNGVAGDDPSGGPEPGDDFQVFGLDPVPGDPDGQCGQIIFPSIINFGGGEELREDVVDAALGMPRDLDGLNGIDAFDHSAAGAYRILPVRVRVQWQSVSGPRTLDLETILTSRTP